MTARIPGTDPDDRDTDENGTDVSVLASATYNGRGQRTSCTLGTGMSCLWEYDPRSFRATRVRSVPLGLGSTRQPKNDKKAASTLDAFGLKNISYKVLTLKDRYLGAP